MGRNGGVIFKTNKSLKNLYTGILHKKIETFAKEKEFKILIDCLVENYYMTVLQDIKQDTRYMFVIENIKKPLFVEIKTFLNRDNYHVCNLKQLSINIPKKCLNKLIKRGLFMSSKPRAYNALIAIHRLVCCIKYENIKNITVHHLDKNKANNSIKNLIPLSLSVNNFLDTVDTETMTLAGNMFKEIIQEEIKKNKSKKRNFISNNENLHKEIIKYSIKHSTKEVINKFKNKIKTKQLIRNILNLYFYREELLMY